MIRKLIIDTCGPDFARRFFLRDGQNNFWNEMCQAWTSRHRDATLWADGDEISAKMRELMDSQIPGEIQSFAAPVFIDVKSDEKVDLEALRTWLAEAVEVFMNANYGTGPGDNSMVMMHLDWDELLRKEDIEDGTNS
jgi:hypothetical protein